MRSDMIRRVQAGEFDTKPLLFGADQTCWRPAQKAPDPELFICDKAKKCKQTINQCDHIVPHECDEPWGRGECPHIPCAKCIPYKEPTAPQPSAVPTSGTGTAPEVQSGHIAAICDRIEKLEETFCNCPAKDIGNLTLRLDNAESSIQHHNARLHEVEQRQGRDRADLMEIISGSGDKRGHGKTPLFMAGMKCLPHRHVLIMSADNDCMQPMQRYIHQWGI